MRNLTMCVYAALVGGGCADPGPSIIIASPVPYEAHVEPAPVEQIVADVRPTGPPRGEKILLLEGRSLERPSEVVGIIDAHEPSGRHEAALQPVRERAAALGADAVVGLEFHHGEGQGEPTHVSGLAVRFLERAP